MGSGKIIKLNILFSALLQLTTIASGFIVPHLLLFAFGSESYGLVSSITQFLNYITLLEGGVSSVIMAALYKPLKDNDMEKISSILNASKKFFRQIGIVYLIYVIILAALYPLFWGGGVEYSYPYVFSLVLILATGLLIQYFASLPLKLLLQADRKVYFIAIVQIISTLVNLLLVYVCIKIFNNLLIVKAISAIVFFIQPISFYLYVKKKYKIDKKIKPDGSSLSQRWDGLGHNIAYFIHSNTDVVVLTIFAGLSLVSVYSVYFMVANALKSLIISISVAVSPSLGRALVSNNNAETEKVFRKYEFLIFFVSFFLFTCGIVLVTPFVNLYTLGLEDSNNYYQPVFGVLLLSAELVYCLRDPYVSICYVAGDFKKTAKFAYVEALINIVVSIILVNILGLIGIAIGTLSSMIFRFLCHVAYLRNHILKRKALIVAKSLLVYGLSSFSIIFVSFSFVQYQPPNYFCWVLFATIVATCSLLLEIIVSFIFFKRDFIELIKFVFTRRQKNGI